MVRGAHGAINKAAANGHNLDVGIVIANVVSNVFEAAQCWEISDGIGKRNLATESHACGQAGHVLFGNAGVEELLGELFHKRGDDAKSQIADDQDDALILFG